MKKNLFLATAVLAIAACTSEEFIGDEALRQANENGRAISFGFDVPMATRAGGETAATALNNNFVVFGYKTMSSGTTQTVFDNYQVNWTNNTANTTTSNSANWEYVGYKNLPQGVSTNAGVSAFSALTGDGQANANAIDQTIKYWDLAATQYDFFAYSLGAGSSSSWAKASALTNSTYYLEGTEAQLGTCYISKKKTITSPSSSATEVELEFRSFLSKIQLKFYETIPGYSVKDVKFYPSAEGTSATTPALYASSQILPTGGRYTVTFDASGYPLLALETSSPAPTYKANVNTFSATLTGYAGVEYKEAAGDYLGRASNTATSTDEVTVLPNPANTGALTLKIDYTLVSRDGTGEEINVTGKTAVVPAAYAQWKPNYKYTYIFKINDSDLYPITLDAVVTDAQDGSQETITTVSEPSITTYAKGTNVTANNEYLTNSNIYVVVDKSGVVKTLTVGTNAKLYKVTNDTGEGSTT